MKIVAPEVEGQTTLARKLVVKVQQTLVMVEVASTGDMSTATTGMGVGEFNSIIMLQLARM